MLPDDIVLNTRRAFSTSNTTVDGYSTSLGAPQGRYIAPANSATCIQVKAGDCAPRSVLLLSPWFKRVDFGVAKRIEHRRHEERRSAVRPAQPVRQPELHARSPTPAPGATIFRTTAAYTDASNTYDPGGRIGQLMVRFNW